MTEVSPSAFIKSVFALYVTFHFYYIVFIAAEYCLVATKQCKLGGNMLALNIFGSGQFLASGKLW